MRRIKQDINSLLLSLSEVESSWKDEKAMDILQVIRHIDKAESKDSALLLSLFRLDFESALTACRWVFDQSKDEFNTFLKGELGSSSSIGKGVFRKNPDQFVNKLQELGIFDLISEYSSKTYSWVDLLEERLKMGRGSAIKGQNRGRALEGFVENIVRSIFNEFDVRCSFQGKVNTTKAKADFAIPNKSNPHIILEAKAYGATGSKQTDVLGDISKITEALRSDMTFLLVTDGLTWNERKSDLKKLVELQNEGYIYRIYTQRMAQELKEDLILMKQEYGLN